MKKVLSNCIAYLIIAIIIVCGATLPAYLLRMQQENTMDNWENYAVANMNIAYPESTQNIEDNNSVASPSSIDLDELTRKLSDWGHDDNRISSRDIAANELTMEEAVNRSISEVNKLVQLGAVPYFNPDEYKLSAARLFCLEDVPYSSGRWSIAFKNARSNSEYQVVVDSIDGKILTASVPYTDDKASYNRLEMLLAFARYHGFLTLEMNMTYQIISERQSELYMGDIVLRGQLVLNENNNGVFRYTVKILSQN